MTKILSLHLQRPFSKYGRIHTYQGLRLGHLFLGPPFSSQGNLFGGTELEICVSWLEVLRGSSVEVLDSQRGWA